MSPIRTWRATFMSIEYNPCLCCIFCGIEISLFYVGEELREAHREWGAWVARKSNKGKRLVVPAAELEQLDLETETLIWSCFYCASE